MVQSLNPDGRSYGTALWEIPVHPAGAAVRLTRSAKGESSAEFTSAGDVLFTSRRADPAAKDPADELPALWQLPRSGEARQIAARPGGIGSLATAGTTVVFTAEVLGDDETTEAERREARKEAGVSAILHEDYPVRRWDQDLGPAHTRLFAGTLTGDRLDDVRDLTPDAGTALQEAGYDLSADGSTVVTTWRVPLPLGESRLDLVAVEVATGARRTLLSDAAYDFHSPRISPDGAKVAVVRERRTTPDLAAREELWIADLATGAGAAHADEIYAAGGFVWAPDSTAVYLAADTLGRRPVYRVPLAGEPTRVTPGDGAFASLSLTSDGSALYALRGGLDGPAVPVRVETATGEVTELPSPAPKLTLPGTLTEVSGTADDGQEIRGWLVLPEGASAARPAPLLLWIHGGPIGSWNDWSWRWNPWIMAAHGYAVLLPDPCMSTGYGQHHIDRGWTDWGPRTQADLETVLDAALTRPDLDAGRVGAMGGSYGGYMANWVAGHSDRYLAIVTHAALWNLEQFSGTTDGAHYWQRELGAPGSPLNEKLSPHRSLAEITTPMLVIHGDRDYRVPIGEALRLWWDLRRTGVESKFLYFPDENHWILQPGNIVVWYETILAFLAQHLLGQEWKRPELLG